MIKNATLGIKPWFPEGEKRGPTPDSVADISHTFCCCAERLTERGRPLARCDAAVFTHSIGH